MAKYRMRLCIKRIQDVVIEAKTETEAAEKAFDMLKTGLEGPEATTVEYVDSGPSMGKDFGKLPKFDSSKKVAAVFKLVEEMKKQSGVVKIAEICRLANEQGIDEIVCRRILHEHRRKWKLRRKR